MSKFFTPEGKTFEDRCYSLCKELSKRHNIPENIVSNIMKETSNFVRNEVTKDV